MLAWEAQRSATWVLALLTSLNVDKESFRIILMEIRSDTFSLLDRFSGFMVFARFWVFQKGANLIILELSPAVVVVSSELMSEQVRTSLAL